MLCSRTANRLPLWGRDLVTKCGCPAPWLQESDARPGTPRGVVVASYSFTMGYGNEPG